LINNIESRTGHGRKAANLEGEYMGSVAHEKAAKLATTIRSWEDLRCNAKD
jgi:hypothetical protein